MAIIASTTILNNKYKIVREIGQGGMGRVWLAEELVFASRLVALKEPRIDLPQAEFEEVMRRYNQEVQVNLALQKVQAPNIVPVYTVEPYEQYSLLSMAYMPNGDLARLLAESGGRLPLDRALAIVTAVLQALRAAHEHPLEIVHRDVKPSNILFDGEHKPYLADFGLAQLGGVSGRSHLPGVRMHPGTPAYMAPEQANSLAYLTPAADIYAVGSVLFEMLAGTKYKRVRPGTLPSSLQPGTPAWVDALVAKATSEDPFDRYSDAGAMLNAVQSGLGARPGADGRAAIRSANASRGPASAGVRRRQHCPPCPPSLCRSRLRAYGWCSSKHHARCSCVASQSTARTRTARRSRRRNRTRRGCTCVAFRTRLCCLLRFRAQPVQCANPRVGDHEYTVPHCCCTCRNANRGARNPGISNPNDRVGWGGCTGVRSSLADHLG